MPELTVEVIRVVATAFTDDWVSLGPRLDLRVRVAIARTADHLELQNLARIERFARVEQVQARMNIINIPET